MKTSKQSKITSVYRDQNVLIRAVLERAGDTSKVLCLAPDYAKRKHLALICDGSGDIPKATLPVANNPAGIDFLIKEVSAPPASKIAAHVLPPHWHKASTSIRSVFTPLPRWSHSCGCTTRLLTPIATSLRCKWEPKAPASTVADALHRTITRCRAGHKRCWRMSVALHATER